MAWHLMPVECMTREQDQAAGAEILGRCDALADALDYLCTDTEEDE